jgi:MFS transporter, DHA1 family, tetracycline resistance protein
MNFKKIDRRLLTILAIVFVQMVGAGMVFPILPLYAQSEFLLPPQTITLLFTSFFLAQFIAGPYLGRLSDRYGRIPVLIVSQIGTAISFVMIGWAPSAAILFIARVVDGITGGNIIVAQAYATDVTPPEKRTETLGYIFASFGLGFIVGPALGGFLAASFGPRIPFYFAAVVATLTILLTWFTLDESLTPEQQAASRLVTKTGLKPVEIYRNVPLILILIVAFVGQFSLGLVQATFALWGEAVIFVGSDPRTISLGIGFLLALVGLTQFISQTFFLRSLLKRFGEANLILAGNILRVFGTLLFAMGTTVFSAGVGSILFPLGISVMMPPLQSFSTRTVSENIRGGVLGVYQSAISLSTIFATAFGGLLFEISPATPYWVGTILGVITIIPALMVWQQARAGRFAQAAPVAGD